MKIISEKSENQLFPIPLICLQSLSNDFLKSNFIFSEDQSEKSENQIRLKFLTLFGIISGQTTVNQFLTTANHF